MAVSDSGNYIQGSYSVKALERSQDTFPFNPRYMGVFVYFVAKSGNAVDLSRFFSPTLVSACLPGCAPVVVDGPHRRLSQPPIENHVSVMLFDVT